MMHYRIRAWIAAGMGFVLITIGSLNIMQASEDISSYQQAIGTLFLTLGALFLGVMASISLSGQSTEEITRNVIRVLEQEGIIVSGSKIRINEKLQAVKPVSKTLDPITCYCGNKLPCPIHLSL